MNCVDSWVLANWYVGGHEKPDNEEMLLVRPLRFHRRQLHKLQFAKGGVRKREGGTRSIGFKRGSFVSHIKHGLCYVGGWMKDRISLHRFDGRRLTQQAKPLDCKFLCYSSLVAISQRKESPFLPRLTYVGFPAIRSEIWP